MPAEPLGEKESRTAKPCGPGTRCWCQVGGGEVGPTGFDQPYLPTTVTRRIRRRGEHGISRQPIAQEMPAVFRWTCGDYRVLSTFAHGLRVHRASGISCALFSFGANDLVKLGRIAPRDRNVTSFSSSGSGAQWRTGRRNTRHVPSFQPWSKCLSSQPTSGAMGLGARPGRQASGSLRKTA
jgi:hypothetical protein